MKTNQKGKSSSSSQVLQSRKGESTSTSTNSKTFKYGAVCFVFLIVGYQICLFIHHASVLRIESLRDHPDTVYVTSFVKSLSSGQCQSFGSDSVPDSGPEAANGFGAEGGLVPDGGFAALSEGASAVRGNNANRADGFASVVRTDTVRRYAKHNAAVEKVRSQRRKVESFTFNPNTVSVEDLQRLGFSQRQAESIDHYRQKGGRFYRAEDFGKSYVVSDSVFARLRAYIRIPKVDINSADSTAFDALPGIGPYYAAQMVRYRERLGGYSCTEQLMELYRFDRERFSKIEDLIECRDPHRFDLWGADETALASHPAIRRRDTARSIILYRDSTPAAQRSVDALRNAGVIDSLQAVMLARCVEY